MTYRCATCGAEHDGLPDLGFTHPDPYHEVPEMERAARTTFTPDRCTVRDADGEHYFIRGVILVPVHGQDEPMGIGVWGSQSQASFERSVADEAMEPTFGWLVNHLAHYDESTYLLKTRVHFRGGHRVPAIELEPTDHPLAVAQRDGISRAQAWAIAHRYLRD
jgi:hypothetical protein